MCIEIIVFVLWIWSNGGGPPVIHASCLRFVANNFVILRGTVLALLNAPTSSGKDSKSWLDFRAGPKVCEEQLHFYE